MSGYYWLSCTLHAGIALDVFTAVGTGDKTAGEIAESIGGDERAAEMLLNALSALGFLEKTADRFSNTESSKTFLSTDSPRYIGYMIRHHHQLVESWSRLHTAVKTGRPVRDRVSYAEEDRRESFLMGMFNIGMAAAPKVIAALDLSGKTRMLDLGGGPGTYAIHFCKKYPSLTAVVADLPTTRPFAEKTIERFGMADRIQFADLDYLTQPIAETFDVILASQILHGENPDRCRLILKKAAGALQRGGKLVVHDFILENTRDQPPFPALFALNMLLGTDGGQAYSEMEIREMMEAAGVKEITRVRLDTPNDSGLMVGVA